MDFFCTENDFLYFAFNVKVDHSETVLQYDTFPVGLVGVETRSMQSVWGGTLEQCLETQSCNLERFWLPFCFFWVGEG